MRQLVFATLLFTMLAGCIAVPVAPAPPVAPVGVVVPPGVVYVAPTYAMPAPGFVWTYHAHYGWGWRHPRRGWHRGWR